MRHPHETEQRKERRRLRGETIKPIVLDYPGSIGLVVRAFCFYFGKNEIVREEKKVNEAPRHHCEGEIRVHLIAFASHR